MNGQVPTHQGAQPQGLEAPSGQNNYFTPNQALQAAQAKQASSQAGKVNAERVIIEQQAAQQGLNPAPVIQAQEVQAQQLAEQLLQGQVDPTVLQEAAAQGDQVAQAALGMAQAQEQRAMQQYNTQQGLGGLN